jgi:deoxyadenosine/deoxycytidine kinase
MKGRLIAVEGPIAAGKTTLARLLADRLGAELVLEPVEENPFLSRFYEDPRALAFRTQLFFLVNRFHEQGQIAALVGRGRDVVADYLFAKDRVFAQLNLSGEELVLYDDVFRLIEPRAPEADLVVLLQADVDTLMARVRARGRAFEDPLDPAYMARVVAAYDEFAAELGGVPTVTADATEPPETEVERVVRYLDSAA